MQVPGCSNIQGNTERMEGTASLNQHAVGSGAEKSYKLYTKRLEEDIYYNVMRFYSPRFNVNNLIAPIKLARDVPKPSAQPPKDKKKNSSYSSDGGQIREGLDFSRLAPYGNAIKNRQNLFRKMTRTYQMSHSEAIEAESRYKDKSMSKYPWKFSDFESSYYYTGTPDGNQDSTYVLLSKAKGSDNEDAFNIIPVKGWYKFTPKPWYRKTADPKAEEAPSSQKSTQAAASSKQLKEQPEDLSSAAVKEKKTWKTKFLDVQQEAAPKKRNREEDEEEELDYEEEFADDEEINLGIEDAEDQKEALGRQFGKYSKKAGSGDDYGDEDELYTGKSRTPTTEDGFANKLRRSLDYKDDDSAEETFIFSDGDEYSATYKVADQGSEQSQEDSDRKSRLEDQHPLSLKGKKIKKELMQQALKKRAVKAPGSHAETAEDDGPLHGTPAASAPEARNPPKTNNLAAGNPSNQTAKSSSATEILKLLSKNPSAKIPDTIKRSKSLNAGQSPTGMQGQLPAACDSDGIRKDSLIVPPKPHKATLEPGDALGLSRRTEISSAKPKKKLVTEEDVIDIYTKRGIYAIKAKELASELVLMCENNAKSKEHLKSLLNRMVRSEGGMLHLLPKYRTQ